MSCFGGKLTIGMAWPSGIFIKGIFMSNPAISAKKREEVDLCFRGLGRDRWFDCASRGEDKRRLKERDVVEEVGDLNGRALNIYQEGVLWSNN